MRYRLVVFDFDGTLADSVPWLGTVIGPVAKKYRFRHVEPAEMHMLRGLGSRQTLARLGLPKWKVPWVAAHMRKLQARDIDQIRLFDGISHMLQSLAGRATVAIVSSNLEPNIRRVLGRENADLVSHFGCGASLFGKRDKLKAVLKKSRVAPHQSIYVGDETRDIEAARSVGMASGAVSWGYCTPEALRAESPTVVFENPADVVMQLADSVMQ